MDWSDWDVVGNDPGTTKSGIYMIRIVQDGNPVHVGRFLGVDKMGIINIGCADNLCSRLWDFVNGRKHASGHSCGNLLYYIDRHCTGANVVLEGRLEYRYSETSDKKQAEGLERILIRSYIKRFGEVPPLNSSIPDRYDEIDKVWHSAKIWPGEL